MALPSDLNALTVTGTFRNAAGSAGAGRVSLTLSTTLTDGTGKVVVYPAAVSYALSGGTFTSDPLVANDNAGIAPSGSTYAIRVELQDAQPYQFSVVLAASPFSFTATSATPAVFTATGSAYAAGAPVVLAGGSLPAGFTAGTAYYALAPSGTAFRLAATPGGTAIASTSAGSGTVSTASADMSALAPVSPSGTPSQYLTVAGGTLTGPLTLAADPVSGLQAATKQYVDGQAGRTFNVRDYGAAGNGSAVDSSDVQLAVAAALAAGGGRLYFPAGTYVMSGVTFGSGLEVFGDGQGNTILLMDPASATGAVVCRVAPPSGSAVTADCMVRDLTIDGSKATWGSSSAQKGYGYYLGQGTPGLISGCFMEDVEIRNCMTYAFDVENVAGVTLTNCSAHDNGYAAGTGAHVNADGFTLIGDDITCTGCKSWNNAVFGFRGGQTAASWHRVELAACEAWGNGGAGAGLGSDLTTGDGLLGSRVTGGRYFSNGAAGIYLSAGNYGGSVTGAHAWNNATSGILVSGAASCTITGCTTRDNATSGASNPEIYLTASTVKCAVTGNAVSSANASHGISEQNSSTDYNTITGNTIVSVSTPVVTAGAHTYAAGNV